jgi:hypothetical protein
MPNGRGGGVYLAQPARGIVVDPKRDEWITKIQPALKKPHLQVRLKACEGRMSRRKLIESRAGRSKPHRKNQELLKLLVRQRGFL